MKPFRPVTHVGCRSFTLMTQAARWRFLVATPAVVLSTTVALFSQPFVSLEEALDEPNLVWAFGPQHPWQAQTNDAHDACDAARCGPLRSGIIAEMGWIETSVQGPGRLSFWWKATATDELWNGDDFSYSFCVGEAVRMSVTEEAFHGAWQPVVVPIHAERGQFTKLKWHFCTLGGCTDPAMGIALLDEVRFVNVEPRLTLSRSGPTTMAIQLTAEDDGVFQIQQSTNSVFWEAVPGSAPVQLQDGKATRELPLPEAQRCFYRLLWLE